MELNGRLHINQTPTRFRKEPKQKYDLKSLVGNCKALWNICYQTVLNFPAFAIDIFGKIGYNICRDRINEVFNLSCRQQWLSITTDET